jgi:sterol desaturase/sphingolipid hydroxylase (fatty acid hydroxylase superfamily)
MLIGAPSAYDNYIIAFYGSWLYCVASWVDYKRDPAAYLNYPGGLAQKLDGIVASVFGWLPAALWFITTVRPTEVWMDSLWREAGLAVLNVVVGDIWFYSFHRLLHWPPLYWLHKKHHEAVRPVGVLALYAHPVDAILVNLGSMMALHLWLRFSFFQIFLIGTIATTNTILGSHTATKDEFHVRHHRLQRYNYGVGLFMDRLLGTEAPSVAASG